MVHPRPPARPKRRPAVSRPGIRRVPPRLGAPSRLDTGLGLEDYVLRYLDNCVDVVCERSGRDAIHLFGYCTSATLAAAYAAVHPSKVQSLGMLAPLLAFDADGGIFQFFQPERANPRRVVDALGNVPGELLTLAFAMTKPVDATLGRAVVLSDHAADPAFVDQFARYHRWVLDPVDVAGRTYIQLLEDLFAGNALMTGELRLDGRRVDPGEIDAPLLFVLGERDEFVPADAGLPFLDVVGSEDTTVISYPTDHVGLSLDESAHATLWPVVVAWYADRC